MVVRDYARCMDRLDILGVVEAAVGQLELGFDAPRDVFPDVFFATQDFIHERRIHVHSLCERGFVGVARGQLLQIGAPDCVNIHRS